MTIRSPHSARILAVSLPEPVHFMAQTLGMEASRAASSADIAYPNAGVANTTMRADSASQIDA